jgi:hypothetical protein
MRPLLLIFAIFLNQKLLYCQTQNAEKTILTGRLLLLNQPLENADVYLLALNKFSITDKFGKFSITEIPPGKFELKVNKDGIDFYDTAIVFNSEPKLELEINLKSQCRTFNLLTAEEDIKNQNMKLLLHGGIAPVMYSNQDTFEKKYNIKYHDFGCTPILPSCIEEYNNRIFLFLDKAYGRKWRKEVRKDVLFLHKN